VPVTEIRGNREGAIIFFVHGSPADHSIWKPLAACAPNETKLLFLDLPDHGQAPDDLSESFEIAERDIVESILGCGDCVTLVGHSLGAYLCARVLPELGSAVSHVVLIAGFPSLDQEAVDMRLSLASALESGAMTMESLAESLTPLAFGGPPYQPEHLLEFRRVVLGTPTERFVREMRRLAVAATPEGKVTPFDTPTVVIHAKGDAAIPLESGRKLASFGRRAELVELTGASHLLHLTHPGEIARWVYRNP
jgi:pimeloyl-ACP methyl ester carboxylesterase